MQEVSVVMMTIRKEALNWNEKRGTFRRGKKELFQPLLRAPYTKAREDHIMVENKEIERVSVLSCSLSLSGKELFPPLSFSP